MICAVFVLHPFKFLVVRYYYVIIIIFFYYYSKVFYFKIVSLRFFTQKRVRFASFEKTQIFYRLKKKSSRSSLHVNSTASTNKSFPSPLLKIKKNNWFNRPVYLKKTKEWIFDLSPWILKATKHININAKEFTNLRPDDRE